MSSSLTLPRLAFTVCANCSAAATLGSEDLPSRLMASSLSLTPNHAADRGVRREAVAAAVLVGDREGELLVQRPGQRLAEGAVQLHPTLEDGWVARHGARHVRGHAKSRLDCVQQLLRLARCGLDWGQTRHRRSFPRMRGGAAASADR